MNFTAFHLPPELATPVLLCCLAALAGLLLWSAGIKVARALSAVLCGLAAATACALFLPTMTALPPLACAVLGLAAGLVVGALGFVILQALALAGGMGVVFAGALFMIQPPAQPVPLVDLQSLQSGGVLSNLDRAHLAMRLAAEQWQAIPLELRQRMVVLGAGIAIIAFAVAILFPKLTTWIFTAAGGGAMLGGSIYLIARLCNPALVAHLPPAPTMLGIFGVFVLAGMLLQYALFRPTHKKLKTGAPAVQAVPA